MRIILILLFLIFSFSLSAQKRDTIILWPDEVPGETEAKHPAVQNDNTSGNVIRLTDVTNPMLEAAYLPGHQPFIKWRCIRQLMRLIKRLVGLISLF